MGQPPPKVLRGTKLSKERMKGCD